MRFWHQLVAAFTPPKGPRVDLNCRAAAPNWRETHAVISNVLTERVGSRVYADHILEALDDAGFKVVRKRWWWWWEKKSPGANAHDAPETIRKWLQ